MRRLSVLALSAALSGAATAAPLDVYILAGQSNMSGRAPLDGVPPFPHAAGIVMERAGHWVPALEPVSDEPEARLGPSMAFADALLTERPGRIGLVPCARGGTHIRQWAPEAPDGLFRTCLARVRSVLNGGTRLAGLLWYQGEYDTWSMADAEAWPERFRALAAAFRSALAAPRLPIVFTQIGPPGPAGSPAARLIALQGSLTLPDAARVSATELPFGDDHLHLTQGGELVLGRRYAAAMLKLTRPE